jgi:hypothetical protein
MGKVRDWGDVGAEGGPGAIRIAGDDPATDIPFDDPPAQPNKDTHLGIADQVNEAIKRGGKGTPESTMISRSTLPAVTRTSFASSLFGESGSNGTRKSGRSKKRWPHTTSHAGFVTAIL